MLKNNKLNPVVTASFLRGRKLNISLVFMTRSYFAVPISKMHSMHYFITKI